MPGVPEENWDPIHTYRCPEDLYEEMKRATADRGETITAVILRSFRQYVRDWPGHSPD